MKGVAWPLPAQPIYSFAITPKKREDEVKLSAAIAKLPPDTLGPDRLIATCRGNVEALAGRGVDLSADLEIWSRQLEAWTWGAVLAWSTVPPNRLITRLWSWLVRNVANWFVG